MTKKELTTEIVKTLKGKAGLKQKVFDTTDAAFSLIDRIKVSFTKTGAYDLQFKVGSDILVFSMHSNVFQFNKENVIWKHSYLKNNPEKGYVGQISIYNFLSDSFKHNRFEDLGYLVARIFINNENHYIVEGKRQLSYRDNDISSCIVDKERLKNIIETAINYAINFDLLVPPYDIVKLATVGQMHQKAQDYKIQTGKRLGFQFNTDDV